jgi:hypothetical protein
MPTAVVPRLCRSATRAKGRPLTRIYVAQLTLKAGAAGTGSPLAKLHPTVPLPSIAPHVTPPITAELPTAKLKGTWAFGVAVKGDAETRTLF